MSRDGYRVFVVSARRPSAVPVMAAHHDDLTWMVPRAEVGDYAAAGARNVIPVDDAPDAYELPRARNLALDLAHSDGLTCVQTDDDLRRIHLRSGQGWVPGALADAISVLQGALLTTGALLAGLPPTPNRYFARPGIIRQAFIISSLIMVAPSPERFDETLPLKEDYDFCCRHLASYGQAARSGDCVAEYRHYANPGGVVSYRTDELEQEITARLLARWPQYLRPHARRPHELTIRRVQAARREPE